MPNDPASDLDVECNVISEYGQSMAFVAERLLKYPDRMHLARSEDERDFIRAEHAKFIRKLFRFHKIAISALTMKKSWLNSLKTVFTRLQLRCLLFYAAFMS